MATWAPEPLITPPLLTRPSPPGRAVPQFPHLRGGSGQVPARGVCAASCQHSCLQLPAARGDAWPGHIRSAPAKAPQRRWVSLQGPISTELIKLEWGWEGRKQHEKLQKSRDGDASLPDPPGPSGLGRGGHAAGTARGELCCLRDRGAAGLWQTTPYLCPRQISLPGQSGGTVAGVQPARRARLSRQWRSPGPAPLLTSEPRVLRGTYRGRALRSGRKHRPTHPDPVAPARAPPPP